MAEFKEELVINTLHPEMAEVGKKYWFADELSVLKSKVEENKEGFTLVEILENNEITPFKKKGEEGKEIWSIWRFIYPYEEPSEQRMTHRMLSEWIAKSNGEYTHDSYENIYTNFSYDKEYENKEVSKDDLIRPWDSEEWIIPTVDIYERDCKGGKE